jgi:hypothetical protein
VTRRALALAAAVIAVAAAAAPAPAQGLGDRFGAAGYFRVMTRPDFQGGDGRLGFWNLYGRLLNEGPWAALALRLDLLPPDPVSREPWTSVHARIEGGSIANMDARMGRLDAFSLTQLYVQAGNVLLDGVTWQVGTLDYYLGDLGLYDARPAQIFFETVGVSARYEAPRLQLLLGAGDSGFFLRRDQYSTIFTVGGLARVRVAEGLEIGAGGQLFHEPRVRGNRFAPHVTPIDVDYEDFLRGEIVENWLLENPGQEQFFPRPVPTSAQSFKLVGYLGFGGIGPVRWNNLFANFQRRHPDSFVTETFGGRDFLIFVKELTDDRWELNAGNEMHLALVPRRLDAVWGVLVGRHWDHDNDVAPSDRDRTFWSTVLRLQLYVGERVHLLGETSFAREISHQGNLYRNHADSVFRSTGGINDARGLEFGDADTRTTWQGKIGWVLSPLGTGIYTRPSLRLLYGVQRSTQTHAFGNSFVESLDQFNVFGQPRDQHWHHVVAVEAETWF